MESKGLNKRELNSGRMSGLGAVMALLRKQSESSMDLKEVREALLKKRTFVILLALLVAQSLISFCSSYILVLYPKDILLSSAIRSPICWRYGF